MSLSIEKKGPLDVYPFSAPVHTLDVMHAGVSSEKFHIVRGEIEEKYQQPVSLFMKHICTTNMQQQIQKEVVREFRCMKNVARVSLFSAAGFVAGAFTGFILALSICVQSRESEKIRGVAFKILIGCIVGGAIVGASVGAGFSVCYTRQDRSQHIESKHLATWKHQGRTKELYDLLTGFIRSQAHMLKGLTQADTSVVEKIPRIPVVLPNGDVCDKKEANGKDVCYAFDFASRVVTTLDRLIGCLESFQRMTPFDKGVWFSDEEEDAARERKIADVRRSITVSLQTLGHQISILSNDTAL